LSCLHDIFLKREDLKAIAKEEINKSHGVLKAALYYSISKPEEHAIVFQVLEDLLKMNDKDLQKENFDLLSHMDELDWVWSRKIICTTFKN
jgi:hypothetical protein